MVNERADKRRGKPVYWLPAGGIDAGEGIIQAGLRETLEEAGLNVVITGVLRMMFHRSPRIFIVVMARPVPDDAPAKTIPNYES